MEVRSIVHFRHGARFQLIVVQLQWKSILRYSQDWANNHYGGIQDHTPRKYVDVYGHLVNPERCPVAIYRSNTSRCPKPLDLLPGFYLYPKGKPSDAVWFVRSPVGRYALSGIVADICSVGGLDDYRTNHSLMSTAPTRLYDADVDEQLTTEVTGHMSTEVMEYKRTRATKKQKLSSIIQGGPKQPVTSSSNTMSIKTAMLLLLMLHIVCILE